MNGPRWQGHLSEDWDTGGRRGRGGGGEKMERMKRGGKDEHREPWFNPYFSFSILHGGEGILSSLGGFRERWNEERGGVVV